MGLRDIKVCVVIPAYNESTNIVRLFGALRSWKGVNPEKRHIIVVNDGSIDDTKKVCMNEGFIEVVDSSRFGKNLGKARAFVMGVKASAKHDPDILITLDADLINLDPKKIDLMVKKLVRSNYYMLVAKVMENKKFWMQSYSGQRAIKFFALNPILVGNKKWLSLLEHGYGLEEALNYLIPQSKQFFSRSIVFEALEPFRNEEITQFRTILATRLVMSERARKAELLRLNRRLRQNRRRTR